MFEKKALTVEKLVDQTLRVGDLHDGRSVPASRRERVLEEFTLLRRDEAYRFNYPLTKQYDLLAFPLTLFGAVDAVYAKEEAHHLAFVACTVDQPTKFHPELEIIDQARAQMLALFYAEKHNLATLSFTIYWYHPDSFIPTEVTYTQQRAELEQAATETLEKYLAWAAPFAGWPLIRDRSIRDLTFPFTPYRAGQREMMRAVYEAQQRGEQALIEAPTGIGKTLASLFPAIKGLEKGFSHRLFYLTARGTGQGVARDALKRLTQKGLRIKAVAITAKSKICSRTEAPLECEDCPYAKGYYTRLQSALHQAYKEDLLFREVIEEVATEHAICPFELSLDLALHADVIIGDYNYVFDSHVYLRRFFAEIEENYTFLIDEVHNLVDRGRGMYTATLILEELEATAQLIKAPLPEVYNLLHGFIVTLQEERQVVWHEQRPMIQKQAPFHHFKQLRTLVRTIDEWLAEKKKKRYKKVLMESYFAIRHYLAMAENYDETYTTIQEITDKGFTTTLLNINPAPHLRRALAWSKSAILFSATVSPHRYFREVLGLSETAKLLSLPSPFPAENLLLLCADQVSTRYQHREMTVQEVLGAIETLVHHKNGNYMVFFPSYEYLNATHARFTKRNPLVPTIIQKQNMTDDERELYLAHFDTPHSDEEISFVGFAVMGGVFGEGIDLVGEKLNGVVIVGVGLPGITPQQEQIKTYFDAEKQGFEYAYTYPGINKVLQAAGRVIRTAEDRGVVMLIDDRFATVLYENLMPPSWRPQRIRTREEVEQAVSLFYDA